MSSKNTPLKKGPQIRSAYYEYNNRKIWYPVVPTMVNVIHCNGEVNPYVNFINLMETLRKLDIAQWVPLAVADMNQHMAWLPHEMDYYERKKIKHTRYWHA